MPSLPTDEEIVYRLCDAGVLEQNGHFMTYGDQHTQWGLSLLHLMHKPELLNIVADAIAARLDGRTIGCVVTFKAVTIALAFSVAERLGAEFVYWRRGKSLSKKLNDSLNQPTALVRDTLNPGHTCVTEVASLRDHCKRLAVVAGIWDQGRQSARSLKLPDDGVVALLPPRLNVLWTAKDCRITGPCARGVRLQEQA